MGKQWSAHMVAWGLRRAAYAELPKAKKAEDLRFNGLRGTAVTLLSEVGNGISQICAVTGHIFNRPTRVLKKYLAMPPALARAAIPAFKNSPATQFANGPSRDRPPQPKNVRITIW